MGGLEGSPLPAKRLKAENMLFLSFPSCNIGVEYGVWVTGDVYTLQMRFIQGANTGLFIVYILLRNQGICIEVIQWKILKYVVIT